MTSCHWPVGPEIAERGRPMVHPSPLSVVQAGFDDPLDHREGQRWIDEAHREDLRRRDDEGKQKGEAESRAASGHVRR